jgi:hypothetical protein
MSPWFYIATLVVLIACGPFAVLYVVERLANFDSLADFDDGDQRSAAEALAGVPETTVFEPRQPLERRRLASVPAQQPRHLRVVRDESISEAEWARLMAVVDSIPEQREPGSAS